jgi:hypothetical protein
VREPVGDALPHDRPGRVAAADADAPTGFALLTAAEPGRRNRRTIDAIVLAWVAVLIGLAATLAASAEAADEDVGQALTTVLGWAESFWRLAVVAALLLGLLIAAAVVLRRRWALGRDLVASVVAVVAIGSVLSALVESDWFIFQADLWSRWGFPELRIAFIAAVVTVAGPDLVRPVRLLAAWLVALGGSGRRRPRGGLALGSAGRTRGRPRRRGVRASPVRDRRRGAAIGAHPRSAVGAGCPDPGTAPECASVDRRGRIRRA